MKLKEYIEALNKLVKENPEALEMEVIYSIDDEGNGYQKVHHRPNMVQVKDLEAYRLKVVNKTTELNCVIIN